MSFQGEIVQLYRKSRISSTPPLGSLSILYYPPPLPSLPPPHTKYNVTVQKLTNLKTVFAICCPTNLLVLEGFSERKRSQSPMMTSTKPCKREANRILDKLHTITENINKHDNCLFSQCGKLKTGLNCLHNLNNEKRHCINSGVDKAVLYVVEELDRVMAKYKATYQTGTKSTTSQARKRKDQRKKKGERGTSQIVKTLEKEHALFSVPSEETPLLRTLSRTYLVFYDRKQLIMKPSLHI